MTAWRVLRVFAGSEFDVATRALADGVEAYCPTYIVRSHSRRRRGGETVESERPMFPRYLFANFSALERKHDQFSPQAYTRALSAGRHRATLIDGKRLSDSQIEAVRATAFLMNSVSDRTTISPGAFVDIWRGLMRGERAQVLRVRGQRAAISLLGTGRVLLIDTSELENIPRAVVG